MRNAEFTVPLLVQVYDAECRWGRDDDFFLGLVNERPRSRVLDLGCGTGRLTTAISAAGHEVTGIDPAEASLDLARTKPGASAVTWLHGLSGAAPTASFDTAVMTSHVAQFLVGDEEWDGTFADLRRALVPGGRVVFDTRDPADRAWERWNPPHSRRRVVLPDGREVRIWTEVTGVEGESTPIVHFAHHYELDGDPPPCSEMRLRFRDVEEVRTSLGRLGFTVDAVFGGWSREAVGQGDGELIVVAHRD